MSSDRPRLVFSFDYISSNAYLAWVALPSLAERYDVEVEPNPVLFAGLLGAHGGLGPAEVPAKALWMWKNNLRKAALLGVPLVRPAFHPYNPLLSLRVSSLPMAPAERRALVDALFRAVWVRELHVSEPDVVAAVASEVGLEGPRLVEEAAGAAAKERLRAQTDAAIARGVFGVPTMELGNELFWGYDDFPHLERCLAGTDPLDPGEMAKWMGAPRSSAVRKEAGERPRRDGAASGAPMFLTSPGHAALRLPFSEAVRVGDVLYLSGQLGNLPGTATLAPGGIAAETRQTLDNIAAALARHGSSLDRVVKCTVFLADMTEWQAMNDVYVTYFPSNLPARSALGASGLALGARVEIECVAVAGS